MKKIQYILIAAVVMFTAACSDSWMTAEPAGSVKTASQKTKAELQNPAAAEANINAMYAQMIALYPGLKGMGHEYDYDFGYPAICLVTDCNGQDFIGQDIGYNWLWNCQYPNNRDNSSSSLGLFDHMIWNVYYKMIYAANLVIGSVDATNPGSQEVGLCQAYCVRALSYFQLAQLYQKTYVGNEQKKCVPIVVPNMALDKQLNNPQATVEKVYELIQSDLSYACNSEAFGAFDRGTNKGYCDQSVAYGLRARVNLVMGNMNQAKEDAEQCLSLSQATPLSIKECGTPGFADGTQHNVIWANIIVETNDVVQTGIINYPSHLSSFYLDGYTGVGAFRSISSELYSQINPTDVRKGWWLNDDNESPLLDAGGYAAAKSAIQGAGIPYITTKFGTGDGTTTGNGAAASDWIIMRAEEMYLIIAEATGDANYLKNFVNTYRDPSYIGTGDIKNDVWVQRRIELWGEGFALQDLLRLHKPINRTTSTNWPTTWNQDVTSDDEIIFKIPEAEIESNKGITL